MYNFNACIIFRPRIYRTASELSALSGIIRRQLAEVIQLYNSRCYQLVLNAGALQAAGLKTITTTILVLASRSLKLVLWLMPFVKTHFQGMQHFNAHNQILHIIAEREFNFTTVLRHFLLYYIIASIIV